MSDFRDYWRQIEAMRKAGVKFRRPSVLPLTGWTTPLTDTPRARHGDARLWKETYTPGSYFMEGVDGYLFYEAKKPLTIRQLQRRERGVGWKTWMVDDPVHWVGMRNVVDRLPAGRLLVAGLGLGLFAHHIHARRPDITSVTVVEIDPDVITLMRPTLPYFEDHRLKVEQADFYRYLSKMEQPAPYDGILWDLAVGHQEETTGDFYNSLVYCTRYAPGVKLIQFGLVGDADTIIPPESVMEAARA